MKGREQGYKLHLPCRLCGKRKKELERPSTAREINNLYEQTWVQHGKKNIIMPPPIISRDGLTRDNLASANQEGINAITVSLTKPAITNHHTDMS